uniref:Uncharacterized protein n=1 Tax=Arundo donax TaxID=35708 RepID=A0A0A9HN24_ARUDO
MDHWLGFIIRNIFIVLTVLVSFSIVTIIIFLQHTICQVACDVWLNMKFRN